MKKGGYLDLFLTFARIGGLTFGGGYAMLPMLQKEVVENRGWATEEELLDYYAVGQCTPGIIAVNVATFIGHKEKGILGGICATLGVVAPSFFIILVLAAFIRNFADNIYVAHALAGIRVAVAALVVDAVIKLWKKGVKDLLGILLFILVFVLSVAFSLSPIWVVLGAILLGLFLRKICAFPEKRGEMKCKSSFCYSTNSSRQGCSLLAAGWPLCPFSMKWRKSTPGLM